MARPRNNGIKPPKDVMLDRRARVAELYLQGFSQAHIAREMKVTQPTVSTDLAAIRKEWKANAVLDYDEKLYSELAKIENLERMATEAFFRSCQDAVRTSTKTEKGYPKSTFNTNDKAADKANGKGKGSEPKGGRGTILAAEVPTNGRGQLITLKQITDTVVEGRVGDPRFLTIIRECIEMRCKLTGLMKEEAKAPTIQAGAVVITPKTWDALYFGEEEEGPDPVEMTIKQLSTPPDHQPAKPDSSPQEIPDAEVTSSKG